MFCYSNVVRRQRHIGSGLCAFPLTRLLYAVMYNYSMNAEAIACKGWEFEELGGRAERCTDVDQMALHSVLW